MIMKELLLGIWNSKHTTIAGLVVLACSLGEIWMPQYTDQFHKTREFAMAYGFVMGGDAVRKAHQETAQWRKDDAGEKALDKV